jgi:hypothetical protein
MSTGAAFTHNPHNTLYTHYPRLPHESRRFLIQGAGVLVAKTSGAGVAAVIVPV